jgi:hypothetical protein
MMATRNDVGRRGGLTHGHVLRKKSSLVVLSLVISCSLSMQSAGASARVYARRVMHAHPLAYWRLNEGSGDTANDSVGHYDGRYHRSPNLGVLGLLAPPSGRSVGLDGHSDRITANALTHRRRWPGYALEAWVRITRNDREEHIVAFNTRSGGNGVALFHDQPSRRFKFHDCEGRGCVQVKSRMVPKVGHRYYLVVTVNSHNRGWLYVNGRRQATFHSRKRPLRDGKFTIGAEYDAGPRPESFYRGKIDEVAVYSHFLRRRRVRGHYRAGT